MKSLGLQTMPGCFGRLLLKKIHHTSTSGAAARSHPHRPNSFRRAPGWGLAFAGAPPALTLCRASTALGIFYLIWCKVNAADCFHIWICGGARATDYMKWYLQLSALSCATVSVLRNLWPLAALPWESSSQMLPKPPSGPHFSLLCNGILWNSAMICT